MAAVELKQKLEFQLLQLAESIVRPHGHVSVVRYPNNAGRKGSTLLINSRVLPSFCTPHAEGSFSYSHIKTRLRNSTPYESQPITMIFILSYSNSRPYFVMARFESFLNIANVTEGIHHTHA